MLNKKINLTKTNSGIIANRGNLMLECPFSNVNFIRYCGEWCPHFNIKQAIDSRRKYNIVLSCKGTEIPVPKTELIKVGVL